MKPFITEQQLYSYKYTVGNKYFNEPLAYILLSETQEFMKHINNVHENVLSLFEHLLHKKVNDVTWVYFFSDDSRFVITKEFHNEEEFYSFNANFFGYSVESFS